MVRVLSCSANEVLRTSREVILRGAGCEVVSSTSKVHALELIQRESFHVLLLGHSLSDSSMDNLCEVFRRRSSNGRVVLVTGGGHHSCKADTVVVGLDGPQALIQAVTGDTQAFSAGS